MRLPTLSSALLVLAGAANAASSWGFSDGSVTVSSKAAGAAGDQIEKFTDKERVKKSVTLGHMDTIKVAVTTKEGSKAKRPHQAFLMLKEASGLEAPFPLTVKESGKGTVELTQRDLPVQFLSSSQSIEASLVVASFGSTEGSATAVFDIDVQTNPNAASPSYEKPLRYGKLPEIHHIFRSDPKNPPKIVSLTFALAVVATVPVLFAGWLFLGANVSDLPKALGSAPLAHVLFFASVVAMEGVFFLYYSAWNLFQTLPVIGVVSVVAFFSGSKALSEVQGRRLAGAR